jgi:CheY-like chemotaxis protein
MADESGWNQRPDKAPYSTSRFPNYRRERRLALTELVRPIEILLVEDNPGDLRLTKEALADAKVRNHLNSVIDGVEALKFLRQEPPYNNAQRPDLILLDLNLPRKDGREVLLEIKNDPKLKRIPVVVVTSSAEEQDIVKSYNLHANCYVTKPIDLQQFVTVVRAIEDFWMTIVKLPAA